MLFADAKIAEPCEIHPLHSKPCPICDALDKGLVICEFCSRGASHMTAIVVTDSSVTSFFCNYHCLRNWVGKRVGF